MNVPRWWGARALRDAYSGQRPIVGRPSFAASTWLRPTTGALASYLVIVWMLGLSLFYLARFLQLSSFVWALRPGTAPDGDVVAMAAVLTALVVAVSWGGLARAASTVSLPRAVLLAPAVTGIAAILAAPAALGSVLPAALVLLGALPIGRWVLGLVRATPDDDLLGWLVNCSVGCGILSLVWGALGSVGLFTPVALALALLGLLALAWRDVYRLLRPLQGAPRWLTTPIMLRPNAMALALGAILTGLTGMNLIAALAPDLGADALSNHLDVATWFVRRASLAPFLESTLYHYSYVPVQVLYAAMVAWSGPIAAKVLHFGFGVLVALGTGALAAHVTGRRVAGVLAAATFAGSSLVWWLAGTGYVDLTITFYFLATICALTRWVELGQRRWLVIAGLCAGIAVPAKLTNLALGGVLVLAVVLRERGGPHGLLRSLLACGVPALLAIAPWAVRSYALAGNPVFPWLNHVFHSPLVEPTAAVGDGGTVWGMGTSLVALAGLPFTITFAPERFVEAGELGIQWLALSPLLLWIARPARLAPALTLLGGSVVLFGLFWIFGLHQNLRYLLPIVPLLAVLVAVGYARAAQGPRASLLAPAVVAVLLVGIAGSALSPHTWWMRGVSANGLPYRVVFGRQSPESYLSTYVQGYGALAYLNATYQGRAQIWAPTLGSRLYSQAPVMVNDLYTVLPMRAKLAEVLREQHAPAVSERLRALGFTHLLANGAQRAWSAPPAERSAYLRPEFLERFAALEYADHGMLVYRLLPAEREPPPRDAPELLVDGGFEAGSHGERAFWTPVGAPLWDTSGGLAPAGRTAVAVDANNQLLSGAVEVVPGRTYRLAVDARGGESDPEAWFQLQFLAADGSVLPGAWARLPYYPDTAYREYQSFATAPAAARAARVRLGGIKAGGWIWIDAVSLTQVVDR